MEKVLVKKGTRVDLANLFTNMQSYAYTNLTRVANFVFTSYGINVKTSNGLIDSTDTSMLATLDGANHLYVNAGDAITSGLHYLNVPTTNIGMNTSLPDGANLLFLKYKPIKDSLTEVVNGFYTQPGTLSVPSKEHAGYEFVWNTNPGVSGVMIASVYKTGSAWSSVTDKRIANVLKLSPKIIPEAIVRSDKGYMQTLTGALQTPGIILKNGNNELDLYPGISGVQTFTGSDASDIKTRLHTHNTDTGTTSQTFRIGVGVYGNAGQGLLAATEPDLDPAAPGNFRVTDIQPASVLQFVDPSVRSQMSLSAINGLSTPFVSVMLKWNWDDIIGTGGVGTFTITTSSGIWAASGLSNYYLYLPAYPELASSGLYVYYNDATSGGNTTLYVRQANGAAVNLTGKNAAAPNYAVIYSDCARYEMSAVPVDSDGNEKLQYRVEETVTFANPIIENKNPIELLIGQRYNFYIRAVKGNRTSSYVKMGAGSYGKDATKFTASSYAYSSPFLAKLPPLRSDGVALIAYTTQYGFIAYVLDNNRWSTANNYEFVWTPENDGASFSDTKMEKRIQTEKTLRVSTIEPRYHNVKVRPLMAGQSVFDPSVTASGISTNIMSGGGGVHSDDAVLTQFDVHHRTYSGMAYVVPDPAGFNQSSSRGTMVLYSGLVYSPASSTTETAYVGQNLVGEIATMQGQNYWITGFIGDSGTGQLVFRYRPLTGASYGTPTGSGISVQIGVSEYGRTLHRLGGFPRDYLITGVFVDCDTLEGTKARVRWYQEGSTGKANADTVLVTQSDTGVFGESDVELKLANGARTLIFDLYDDGTSPDNTSGIDAHITVYAKALTPTVVKPPSGVTKDA